MTSRAFKGTGKSSVGGGLEQSFSRWGWAGFWGQLAMGAIPLAIMIYTFLFAESSAAGSRPSPPLIQYLSSIDLLLLIFVTGWFFRYTRIAKRMNYAAVRPSISSLRKTVWIGVVTATLAILFSMLVLLFEVSKLLFFFLSAPQGGLPALQATPVGLANWVSAVDMLSLISLILTLGGEILALIFGLILLFRTDEAPPERNVAT